MKFINKDALVAEMKRRISNLEQLGDRKFIEIHFNEQFRFIKIYEGIIDFINALEIKESDIESAAITDWNNYIKKINGEPDDSYMLIKREDYIMLAKHFFELDLKAQKGE